MLRRQSSNDEPAEIFECGNLLVGHVGCWVTRNGGSLLIVSGNPVGPVSGPVSGHDIATYKEAIPVLTSWDGAYAALYWDDQSRKLLIVSDFLGLKPLYWAYESGSLEIASDTKAFQGDPDLSAWGAFIALGYTIGTSTLMEGLERVPPATVAIYDADTSKLETSEYWSWPSPGRGTDSGSMIEALRTNAGESLKEAGPGTLLLSGGFDSRLIAYLLAEMGAHPKALIVSHKDENLDVDGKYAEAIARQLGLDYEVHIPDRDFFSSPQYLEYVWSSDAAHPSLYLFIAQIYQYLEEGAVWDGLVPGYTVFPPVAEKGGFRAFFDQEGKDEKSGLWPAARQLFTRTTYDQLRAGFEESWRRETGRYSDDGHGIEEFLVKNRVRNRTGVNPFKVFSNKVDSYSLGASKKFFETCASVDLNLRRNHEFYIDIFARHFPNALRVPFVSGSSLFRASPWSAAYYLDKAAISGLNWINRHPSVLGTLGLPRALSGFDRSVFLDSAGILADGDAHLNPETMGDIRRKSSFDEDVLKLLFYWRTWHWVHQGNSPSMIAKTLSLS